MGCDIPDAGLQASVGVELESEARGVEGSCLFGIADPEVAMVEAEKAAADGLWEGERGFREGEEELTRSCGFS